MGKQIAQRETVAEMILRRNKYVEWCKSIYRILQEMSDYKIKTISNDRQVGSYSHDVKWWFLNNGSGLNNEGQSLKRIDRDMWRDLIKSFHLVDIMTEKAHSDLQRKLEEKTPEFTIENIKPIIDNAQDFYGSTILNSINEVYRALIGCGYRGQGYGPFKRDNCQKVEEQFRICGSIYYEDWRGGFSYDGYRGAGFKYEDLFRVCKLLDGAGAHDYSDTFNALALSDLGNKGDTVETRYFTVKCYKNGNQKVTWKRLDVLQLLNRIGAEGSNALPDSLRKRYKPEHFGRA